MNNGVTVIMEEDATITFQPANTQPRIDRIVLRNNDDVQERRTSVIVLTGTPSATPKAPAYTRNATIHDLVLADVRIGANVTSVVQSAITDRRLDSSVCGIVAGTIEEIDTSTLYAQIQADLAEAEQELSDQLEENQATFDTWFNSVKDSINKDEALHLQKQINDINEALQQAIFFGGDDNE